MATVYRAAGRWYWRRIGLAEAPLAAGCREEALQLAFFYANRVAASG